MEKNDFEKEYYSNPKYEYVRTLADYLFPPDEDNWEPIEGLDIMWSVESGYSGLPFKRQDYDINENIQDSLALMGLDPDKFWELMRFIHTYSDSKFTDGIQLEESLFDTMIRFGESLNNDSAEITVKIKDKKLFQLAQNKFNICLYEAIYDYCKKRIDDPGFRGSAISLDENERVERDPSVQIYDEYHSFEYIIDKFRQDKGLPTRVKGQKGSRNVKLLISRLMYFTGLTNNKVFNEDVNALKGIINKYKDKPIDIVSGRFLV